MRDMKHNISAVQVFAPAAVTSTANGTTVDLAGFNACTFVFDIGVGTDGGFAFSIEESDNDSDWTTVDAGDLIGTAPDITAAASPAEDETIATVGYVGSKRYVRAAVTVTGSPSTGMVFGVQAIKGHPLNAPTE